MKAALFLTVLLTVTVAWSVVPNYERHDGAPAAIRAMPASAGPLYTRTILVSNAGSVATGTYEQRLSLNSATIPGINGNWTNVELAYPNGTAIPTWLEANATATSTNTILWSKLYSIAGHGSARLELEVFATATFVLSPTGAMGEAPKLSGSYGKFDNGAQVFPLYDNFAGTSLDSTLWVASGDTLTVNNGLTTSSAPSPSSGAVCGVIAKVQNVTVGHNVSFDLSGTTGNAARFGPAFSTVGTSSACSTANDLVSNLDYSSTAYQPSNEVGVFSQTSSGTITTNTCALKWANTPTYEMNLQIWGTSSYVANNETNLCTASGGPFANFTVSSLYPAIWLKSNSGSVGPVYWARERNLPPGGAMLPAALVPAAPTALNATTLNASAVSLTWSPPPGSVANESVSQWNGSACSGTPYKVYSEGAVTNATIGKLNASATYAFQVAAWNATGRGDLSVCVTALTTPPPWITAEVVSGTVILGIFLGVGIAGFVALTAGSKVRDRRRARRRPGPP